MGGKKLFEAGELVTAHKGQAGIVIAEEAFSVIRAGTREGKRPGYYFAPGCCHHPDYVTQVPVLFEDGTYDVMRAMGIRKAPQLPEEKKALLHSLLRERTTEGETGTQ